MSRATILDAGPTFGQAKEVFRTSFSATMYPVAESTVG